jgi:hypothetical protein
LRQYVITPSHSQQVANSRDVHLQLTHLAHANVHLGNDLGFAVGFLDAEVAA